MEMDGKAGVEEKEEEEATMTVTIALDNHHIGGAVGDDQDAQNASECVDQENEEDALLAAFLVIPPPPTATHLLANWQQQCARPIRLSQLPANVINLLEIRLNPPACGSMRNWEFLAAHFGLSLDEIVGMRRSANPMGHMLRKFGHESLLKLLEMVGQSGRIDVLLSLAPFAPHLAHLDPTASAHHSASDSALISSISSSSYSINSGPGPSKFPPTGPFLLILHHEMAANKDLRRFHRMLMKNLDRYGQESGVKVLDVDHCIAEEDLFGSAQRHFEQAWQILLALSPDYAEQICGTGKENEGGMDDQKCRLKRHLHQMTFQEVLYNGGENRRFRLVLMRGTRAEHLPRGWPSNTLHYRFPEDFADLCERVFDRIEKK